MPWGAAQLALDGRAYAPRRADPSPEGESILGPLHGVCQGESSDASPSALRRERQMVMWDLLGPEKDADGHLIPDTGERCAKCEKVRIAKPGVEVQAHRSSSGSWSHSGLSICHNAHACAPCAYRRARELAGVFSACITKWTQGSADALAPDVWLLSLTLPHTAELPWDVVVSRLRDAWRYFVRSIEWARFKKRWGIIGAPRVWDETIGRNGLHGHWHVALFTSHAVWDGGRGIRPMRELEPETRAAVLSELQAELAPAWERAARAVGAVSDRNAAAFAEHGMDLRGGENSAAYLVKWGMPEELALSPVKRGRNHWDLLDAAGRGSKVAAEQFRAYYEATRGLAVVTGLGALRKELGIDDAALEAHLEELAELRRLQAEFDGEPIVEVPPLTVTIHAHVFNAALAVGWHRVHNAADAADTQNADPQAAVDALLADYQRRKRERSRARNPSREWAKHLHHQDTS